MIEQEHQTKAPTLTEAQAAYVEDRLLELASLEELMQLRPLEEPGSANVYNKAPRYTYNSDWSLVVLD